MRRIARRALGVIKDRRRKFGADKAGGEGVDHNPVARPGLGHGAGHLGDAALARAIGYAAGKGAKRLQRGKVHDPAPAFFLHRRDKVLAQEKRRAEVQRQGDIPALGRDIIGGLTRIDPCRMHHDIGRPERHGGGAGKIGQPVAIGKVMGNYRAVVANLGLPFDKRLGAARNTDNAGTVGHQHAGRAPPQPRACAGDQSDTTGHIK